MYRPLLVLDLDGTILDDKKRIYTKFLEILPDLKKRFEILVASGRAKVSVERYLEEMELPERYVSFEGAYTVWEGEVLYDRPFKEEEVGPLLKAFEHLPRVVFYLNRVLPDTGFMEEFSQYLKRWAVEEIGEEESGIYKVVFAKKDGPDNPKVEDMEGTVFVYRRKGTDHVFYDIAPPDTGKLKGVLTIMERLKVDPRRCVVLGDYYNDIPLFRICGLSIAVPNAPEAVKREADFVKWPWEIVDVLL